MSDPRPSEQRPEAERAQEQTCEEFTCPDPLAHKWLSAHHAVEQGRSEAESEPHDGEIHVGPTGGAKE